MQCQQNVKVFGLCYTISVETFMYLTTNVYRMCEDDECYLVIYIFKNDKIVKNIIYSNLT